MPEDNKLILRRYRRYSVDGLNAARLLMGELKLVLPDDVRVVNLMTNPNLFPLGFTLVLYSEKFEVIDWSEELPIDIDSVRFELTSGWKVIAEQLDKVSALLGDAWRDEFSNRAPDEHSIDRLSEARARVAGLIAGTVYVEPSEEVRA